LLCFGRRDVLRNVGRAGIAQQFPGNRVQFRSGSVDPQADAAKRLLAARARPCRFQNVVREEPAENLVTGLLGPDPIDLGLGVGVEEATRKLLVSIEGDFNRIPAVLFVEDADFKVCVTGS